jgi:hypothetical protein
MIKQWIYSLYDPFTSFLLLYLVIFILTAIVYKLGFARKLPILKSFAVYVVLAIGCILLALLGTDLPMADSLVIAVIVLAIVRFRMRNAAPLRDKPKELEE